MTWNLRLVKHVDGRLRRTWYSVHEVFYTDTGKPWAMTQEPVQLDGESPEEVRRYLNMIRRDLRQTSVLNARNIKWAKNPFERMIKKRRQEKTISFETLKKRLSL